MMTSNIPLSEFLNVETSVIKMFCKMIEILPHEHRAMPSERKLN